MIPEYLNKVKSDKKALEIGDIFGACHPTHSERLWLVGFLKYAGYNMSEVLDLIHDHCHWCDYNERITIYQVGTVFHQCPQRTQSRITRKLRKWDLRPIEVLRIRYQRAVVLSKQLCEENKEKTISFQHPERLTSPDFNPSAEFLRK